MTTLNQRLRFFPAESRAESSPLCKQENPIPPPINRCGFHGLSMKKVGSKLGQKASLFLVSATSLSPPSHQPTRATISLSATKSTTHYQRDRQPTSTTSRTTATSSSLSLLQNPSPFFMIDSGHCSSQQRRQNHQLNLLITTR